VTLINAFPRETPPSESSAPPQFPPLTDQQRFDLTRWLDVQPVVDVTVSADGAKVVIVKFNDYQCPACKQAYELNKDVLAKYTATGRVKYVTKHYPLEPECNASVPNVVHSLACETAAAVVMAESKGTSDKLEDWLFTNQATLTAGLVKQAAADVGGITDFDAQYTQALTRVRSDVALGSTLKVKSTPTLFINGRRIETVLPPPYLEAAIEHELRR
jgi:protein-disulfide isomerase